jgi:hypothetical protein
MGMFDYNTGYSEGLTPGQRARRRADQSEQQLVDRQISPLVEKHTGYVSPKVQLQRMASQTDLRDGRAVQKTYNAILAKNPTAAQKWLESIKPIITQHIEQQKLAATLRGKQGERKIIKDAQGRQRYVDDKSLVFPGVADKPAEASKPSDLPQMTAQSKEQVSTLVDETFDFGMLDFEGQKTAVSKEALTDFVFSYSQIKNVPTTEVLRGLVNGTIQYDSNIGNASSGQVSPPSSSNPFNVPAQPK